MGARESCWAGVAGGGQPPAPADAKTPPVTPRALPVIWRSGVGYAAMVAWACSLQGPRSPVGETQRIQT